MALKLNHHATFRIERTQWRKFTGYCKRRNIPHSTLIRRLIDALPKQRDEHKSTVKVKID